VRQVRWLIPHHDRQDQVHHSWWLYCLLCIVYFGLLAFISRNHSVAAKHSKNAVQLVLFGWLVSCLVIKFTVTSSTSPGMHCYTILWKSKIEKWKSYLNSIYFINCCHIAFYWHYLSVVCKKCSLVGSSVVVMFNVKPIQQLNELSTTHRLAGVNACCFLVYTFCEWSLFLVVLYFLLHYRDP